MPEIIYVGPELDAAVALSLGWTYQGKVWEYGKQPEFSTDPSAAVLLLMEADKRGWGGLQS